MFRLSAVSLIFALQLFSCNSDYENHRSTGGSETSDQRNDETAEAYIAPGFGMVSYIIRKVCGPGEFDVSSITPPLPVGCTAQLLASELAEIKKILDEIAKELAKKWPSIGSGWTGNVLGGPKCSDVVTEFQWWWQQKSKNRKFSCYKIQQVFDSGILPYDAAAHVAMGLFLKDRSEPIAIIDPWRYGNCALVDPKECPNSFGDDMGSAGAKSTR